MADDVVWAAMTDPRWSPKFDTRRLGAIVRLTGHCPRCDHRTATDFTAVIPSKTVRADEERVTLFCKCGFPHKGHPENDPSCGAYWTTTATL